MNILMELFSVNLLKKTLLQTKLKEIYEAQHLSPELSKIDSFRIGPLR